MKNNQQSLAIEVSSDFISVHEIFSTIQGEGPFVGRRATFIRLYGCNLQCPLCDTDYTSSVQNMEIECILAEVDKYDNELIVITGGEPFRQNLFHLIRELNYNYQVQIETNGTIYETTPDEVTIVCSPKESYIAKGMYPDYFKYVLHHKFIHHDGLPTIALANRTLDGNIIARPPRAFPRSHIYVQPVETGIVDVDRLNLAATVASCREFGYTLCLQVHKIINLP